MQFTLKYPLDKDLLPYIDYYLFIRNDKPGTFSYTTIPNINSCLALYKQNDVHWDINQNICDVRTHRNFFSSRFFFGHTKPFIVNVKSDLDQVCIIFKIGALRHFTDVPVNVVDRISDPAIQIFGKKAVFFAEQLFEQENLHKRVQTIDSFLKQELRLQQSHLIEKAIKYLLLQEQPSIQSVSTALGINNSTLYRNFITYIGESPKDVLRKFRFRSFLKNLKVSQPIIDSIALSYTDHSHLIKEAKQFTGMAPFLLKKRITSVKEFLYLPG